MNAGAAALVPTERVQAQVLGFVRPFIKRALRDRVRYRYVQPLVLQDGEGLRIQAPCCSRNVDPVEIGRAHV